ncbi:hypothetical protein BJ508DRAFT_121652 [Ascobolus immersus RN42]|uniref:Uncharacterized protein n=1 Tax=Ascobolus immersus RN42 TaxID=1160509 RepID=A0A3N4IZ19_ASCIM|nr:hypothetical protein BJ508DRAFT_121652 [Ascobolus immersus RN42]
MSTKVPKPMIRPPTKAQAKLVNKKTSTDKAGEEKRPQTAADLLSSDEEEEDAGTAPPKKTTTVTKPLTLTQQKELRQLERQNRLTTKPQWSNANIDTPLTATRMRPKAKINEKTLEREQDIDAHWEDRAFGKVRKYDKKRTSIGADGTKVLSMLALKCRRLCATDMLPILDRPIVNSKASSGFINPMDEFGDTMEDVNEKIKTNKQRKAKAATKARAPRFEDPVEEFGGLVKDVKSKIRKTKASGWTDPASVFGEVEGTSRILILKREEFDSDLLVVPDSPAFSSQADPVFS